MIKKIFVFFLISVILILCLPLSGWAETNEADKELYEKYAAKLDSPNRVKGDIIVHFKQDIPADQAYRVLFDICADAYETEDEAFIDSKIDFVERFYIQIITVPDEIIVETMVKLIKNPAVDLVAPNHIVEKPYEGVCGDVNGNGKVDSADYAIVKRTIMKTYVIPEEQFERADLNNNGKLDSGDYAVIKRIVLGTYSPVYPVN